MVAFSFLTPFFFLKGGMNVSAGALWGNLGVLALLFGGKMVPKLAGVYPFARRFTAPHGGVHHPVDVDRPDLRNDQRVVRPDRVYQPEAADELTKDAVEMAEAY